MEQDKKAEQIQSGIARLNGKLAKIEARRNNLTLIPLLRIPSNTDKELADKYTLINNGFDLINDAIKQFQAQALEEVSGIAAELRAEFKKVNDPNVDKKSSLEKRKMLIEEYNQKVQMLYVKEELVQNISDPVFELSIEPKNLSAEQKAEFDKVFQKVIRPYFRFGYLTAAQLAVLADLLVGVKKAIQKTIKSLPEGHNKEKSINLLNEYIADVISLMKMRIDATLATVHRKVDIEKRSELTDSLIQEDFTNLESSIATSFLDIGSGNNKISPETQQILSKVLPANLKDLVSQIPADASINKTLPPLYMRTDVAEDKTILGYFFSFIYNVGKEDDLKWANNHGYQHKVSWTETFLTNIENSGKSLWAMFVPDTNNPYVGVAKDFLVKPLVDMGISAYDETMECINLMRGNFVAKYVNEKIDQIQQNKNVIAVGEDLVNKKDHFVERCQAVQNKINQLFLYIPFLSQVEDEDNIENFHDNLDKKVTELNKHVENIEQNWVFVDEEGSIAEIANAALTELDAINKQIDEKIKKYEQIKKDNSALLKVYKESIEECNLTLKDEMDKIKKAQELRAYRSASPLDFIKNLFGTRKVYTRDNMIKGIMRSLDKVYKDYEEEALSKPFNSRTLSKLNDKIKEIFTQEIKKIAGEGNLFKSKFQTILEDLTKNEKFYWNKEPKQVLKELRIPINHVHFAPVNP